LGEKWKPIIFVSYFCSRSLVPSKFKGVVLKLLSIRLKSIDNNGAENGSISGILLEYEDMFPFSGELAFARSSLALTEQDVLQLLGWARDLGLEVVPLVQTFGHLEWILKHERFAHLREVDRYAQVICLSNMDAVALVKSAVDQVMRLHKDSGDFFHMGADEAFQVPRAAPSSRRPDTLTSLQVGLCQRCQQTISSQLGNLRDRLMLRHIANISSHVRDRFGKRVLMWHDMLNNVDPALIREFKLETLVEPVVWNYAEQVDAFLPPDFWQRFALTFPFIWGSSAFKGALRPSPPAPEPAALFRRS